MDFSPLQREALDGVSSWLTRRNSPVFRLFGYAGTGKAQPVQALVQTPDGPQRIGDLHVGDSVFGQDGTPKTVRGIFPQGVRPTYRVTFRDKTSVLCSGDHLWKVHTARGSSVRTLRKIMAAGLRYLSGPHKFRVPLCEAVEYEERSLPLAPYLLGAFIGDGTSLEKTPTLCTPDSDRAVMHRAFALMPAGVECVEDRSSDCPRYRATWPPEFHWNEVAARFRALGLAVKSPERFIPRIYLKASVEQRRELLRGLMDTDGSCRKNRTSFSTMSPQLCQDICELVQSLGGTAIASAFREGYGYQINIKVLRCPFHLPRKAREWSPSKKNPPSRYIVGVEPAGQHEHVCIQVEGGLYLTDAYVVTHNTTLARHLADGVKGRVLYAAFTGKAALVLQQKGAYGASTIHQLIYTPKDKSSSQLKQLRDELEKMILEKVDDDRRMAKITAEISREEERLNQPAFGLNTESDVCRAALVIIDEVSMVGERIGNDLLSFKTPVLVLGDPAQLPPVRDTGFFTEQEPDILLTEIHRQAAQSPVIALATDVRQGRSLALGTYGDSRVVSKGTLALSDLVAHDMILCGLNRTRRHINRRIRQEILGKTSHLPEPGDRLVCLRNNYENGLLNGSLWTVENSATLCEDTIGMTIRGDDSLEVITTAHRHGFEGREIPFFDRMNADAFDYGYCLTCHKAQGSAWPSVVVINEARSFRQHARNWLYTALTRASEKVTVVIV